MKRVYNVIGLMSGTSMDGLDVAYCSFEYSDNTWGFDIVEAITIPYNEYWMTSLDTARELSNADLNDLSIKYGQYLGSCVADFITENEIEDIDFIASHGHTIHHQPSKGITVQIGDGTVINKETNLPVVYDFRIADVELGGQGAPLVPIGDQLLFSKYQACLNLGGFANISFQYRNERIAFDISPINIVLNYLARMEGKSYDKDGEMSSTGIVIPEILNELNQLEYYKNPVPKSLGIEWVEKEIYTLLLEEYPVKDTMRTVVAHVVTQISNVLSQYKIMDVLVTGGGAFNSFFMSELQKDTHSSIVIPDKKIIEFKEALIFAFMGVLRMENQINVLKSVTGALKNHSSGKIVK